MSQYFEIHPDTPQPRLVKRAVEIIRAGGVIAYPTDSRYALGCHLDDKPAMERLARIRQTDKDHNFTLVCSDLSEIARYARVDNWAFRLLKAHTPGPFTFILKASNELPRRLQNPKRKTIGIRVPGHPVAQALLAELGEPLMSSTLWLPGDALPFTEGWEIRERFEHELDLVIDGGHCGIEPTTVVELDKGAVRVLRHGQGDASAFD
ncbi:MAG: L-threonylcarbamoyladenylate synthase [Gammaproteobacteria bacterium]|nr:L-threonylcarbamoyladenylate synthase [Gammaproteobacteria bacterium]